MGAISEGEYSALIDAYNDRYSELTGVVGPPPPTWPVAPPPPTPPPGYPGDAVIHWKWNGHTAAFPVNQPYAPLPIPMSAIPLEGWAPEYQQNGILGGIYYPVTPL